MLIKTSELIDLALDWAVAKCEGYNVKLYRFWLESENTYWKGKDCSFAHNDPVIVFPDNVATSPVPKYSTEWSQGGPIIERERINIRPNSSDLKFKTFVVISPTGQAHRHVGPTPLIAAMRTFVASTLGDEVEIPEELL